MHYIMLLPKDAQGCPVLSIDGTCLEKRSNWVDNRDRCIFYMFSLLAEDEMSQRKGLFYFTSWIPRLLIP
jgi:hypothetical protein